MKRSLMLALTGVLTAGQLQSVEAQRASLFDLGVYGGVAYNTDWLEINEEGYATGFNPIMGVTATYWATPRLGVRVHGAYMPSELPRRDDDTTIESDDYYVNNYLYDLDLVYRPWVGSEGSLLSSTYLFAGAGGFTTNVAGDAGAGVSCVGNYTPSTCLSLQPTYATVGQGVVGVGADLLPIGSNLGIFGELAVHGYDSPAHVFDETVAEDKFVFTPRLTAGVKLMVGNVLPPAPVVVEVPRQPQPLPPVAPVAPRIEEREINVCVLQNGNLQNIRASYRPATGDTLVMRNGQMVDFSSSYPTDSQYGSTQSWFISGEPVQLWKTRYVKYGLPRIIGVNELQKIADHNGIPVFGTSNTSTAPAIIYMPVRQGCEFQPYQKEEAVRNVRG